MSLRHRRQQPQYVRAALQQGQGVTPEYRRRGERVEHVGRSPQQEYEYEERRRRGVGGGGGGGAEGNFANLHQHDDDDPRRAFHDIQGQIDALLSDLDHALRPEKGNTPKKARS